MSSRNNGFTLRSELFRGVAAKWYKYLLLLLIAGGFCAPVYTGAKFYIEIGDLNAMPTTMDYLLYLFRGMRVYIPSPDNPFQIPYMWLALNLYIAFTTASYPTNDLAGFGKHILIRSKTRTGWYLNKCAWATANVAVCYMMIFLAPLFFSILSGNVSSAASGESMAMYLEADFGAADPAALLLSVIFLPLLTMLALSLLQVFLEFVLSPIFGFTIIACVWLASAYLYTPFLIGNFTMFLRSEFAMGEEGLGFTAGVIINLCIIIAAVVIGCRYFKTYDILEKE